MLLRSRSARAAILAILAVFLLPRPDAVPAADGPRVVDYPARLVTTDAEGPLYATSTRYSFGARTTADRIRLVADTDGGCETDGSASVQICLTQFFRLSGTATAVERYAATWTRLDRQAALRRGVIRVGVLGRCLPTSCEGTLNDSQELLQAVPTSGAAYTLVPRWAGRYVDTEGDAYQRGVAELDWGRGTATSTVVHTGVGR